jgi:nicotinamidase/pyrazinamidase
MPNEKIVVDPETDAILHTDVQTAFMPDHQWDGRPVKGGGLPVPGGHEIIPVVLRNTSYFPVDRRFASLDQHPADEPSSLAGHISWATSYKGFDPYHDLTLTEVESWEDGSRIVSTLFDLGDLKAYLAGCPGQKQTLWPKHGPAGSEEAELHPALADLGFRLVLIKGHDPLCDSYSAESDNLGRSTGLAEQMADEGVKRVFMDGNAFTHCVGWGALGFAKRGFEVFVIKDGTRSVPIPGLEEAMTRQLEAAGVRIITSDQLAAE